MGQSRTRRTFLRSFLLVSSVALLCSLFGKGFLTPRLPQHNKKLSSVTRRALPENRGSPDQEALRRALRLPSKVGVSHSEAEEAQQSGMMPWDIPEEEQTDYWSGFAIGFLLTGWLLCFM